MGSATSPWSAPGIVQEDTEKHNRRVKNETDQDIDASTGKAKTGTRDLTEEQYDTDPTKLNKWQNSDYARNGGQYGRLNNRNYNTTLRLAREADRYNQAPRENFMVFGNGYKGGMGTQKIDRYEKPQLETMETRAMNQSWNLDTNQKMLAQALQDAVNHKDLEAFKDAYKQLYGIELDEMQAELAFTQLARTMQVQNIFSKDSQRWMSYFNRAFGAETALTIYNMVDNNPMAANMLAGQLLNGTMPPDQFEKFVQEFEQTSYERYKASGMSDTDAKKQAALETEDFRLKTQREWNVQNRTNTNWTARAQDRWNETKSTVKGLFKK